LVDGAKEKWNQIIDELKELGLVTNLDINALAIYCDALYRYEKAVQKIEQEGETIEYTNKGGATNLQQNPQVRIANQFAKIAKGFGGDLGLTPSHRLKLVVPKEEKKEDPFGDLFDP
jgi:P27 family predicted phage terminase small subunit